VISSFYDAAGEFALRYESYLEDGVAREWLARKIKGLELTAGFNSDVSMTVL
jgi:hypothetical protein